MKRSSTALSAPQILAILLTVSFCWTALADGTNPPSSVNEFASDRVVAVPAPAAPITLLPKPAEPPATIEPRQIPEVEEPHPGIAEPARTEPNIRLRGRIEADAIMVNQDQKNKFIYGNFQNTVGFRRARIGAEGSIGEQAGWVAEFDFAQGTILFRDMFLAVKELPIVREVRVGNMREPFSLEGDTSSRWFTFAERSPQNALDPGRNWGVGVLSRTDDRRWFLHAGAFRSGANSNATDIGDGNDMAYTGKIVFLPIYEESDDSLHLLHIGGAASQRYAKNDMVTFSQSPQSTLLQTNDSPLIPFVPNIAVPATQNQLYNIQSALVLGPLSLQAEWSATNIEQIGGGPVYLYGAYVCASYFLTGEHKQYDRDYGTFTEQRINNPFMCLNGEKGFGRGPGAWELTARLASLNFNSPNLAIGADGLKVGNQLATLTLGINWYLNSNARIMFNYVHYILDNPDFGSSLADSFTIRSAIFW